MNGLILTSLALPLLGFILIFLSDHNEQRIARISFWCTHAMGLSLVGLLLTWANAGFPNHEYPWFTLYETSDYRFPILFYLDKVGAVYLFCIWAIFSIIVKYCRVYLHREEGYQRFFMTIFSFVFGLNIVILSGSIDILFAGWEIVGISSFLLIAFYRHRVQPIRNALRAYTIYRFCDIGLLLGAWLCHLLFHENQRFSQFAELFSNPTVPPADYAALLLISILILIAAMGKSAQFPFCFWLPRAMEGPTPSSAIFYGALSVHLGVFLLLRTLPIWSYYYLPRFIMLTIGLLTVIVASISEKTQSNIKGQIAYASITQVGFMFMELALGLEYLVLVHFFGNAFLRCYQLLVSPSIVVHLLRVESATDADFNITKSSIFESLPPSLRNILPEVLQNTLYVFSLQEGHLEMLVRGALWSPLKRLGSNINRRSITIKLLYGIACLAMVEALLMSFGLDQDYVALPLSMLMVLSSLSAFSEKRNPYKVWNAIGISAILSGVAVCFLNPDAWADIIVFASGIIPAWVLGIIVLSKLLKNIAFADSPFTYRAFAETQPTLSVLLFISFLGLVGFPISPAFLGEDLLLSDASDFGPWFALPLTMTFVINGIAAARVFLRLCMGRPTELSDSPR